MMKKSVDDYFEFLIHNYFDDLKILEESSDLYDDELDSLYGLGYNLFTYGKYEKSKEIFEKLTKEFPSIAYLWRALGAINQQLKLYDEAIKAYSKAITYDEADVISYVYRAESRILSGEVELALEDFKKVVKIGEADINNPWVTRSKLILSIYEE